MSLQMSFSYEVPNLRLIPQDKNNACWYASAMMLHAWYQQAHQMSVVGPQHDLQSIADYKANNGLLWAQMRNFARRLGLRPGPLMTPTEETLLGWLRRYGPLWVDGIPLDKNGAPAGNGHVVVFGGLRNGAQGTEIKIYDPWPPNVGDVSWWPLSRITGILQAATNPNRDTFFLYYGD